ncbi:MAG: dihydrodipicolinate synthase family protein, partial [Carbonactinosporaceae bacterium]
LLETVKAAVPTWVPVLAGTGAPSARQAVALTTDARKHGADGVLALSPPGSRRLLDYYSAVAEAAGDLPVLGYHFPNSSAPGIPLDALPTLPLDGLKDSSGDPERMLVELDRFNGWLYVGSAVVLAYAGPLGCSGAILQLANAEPELCVAAFGGDREAQRELLPAHLQVRQEFPRGLKQAMSSRYGVSPACRL